MSQSQSSPASASSGSPDPVRRGVAYSLLAGAIAGLAGILPLVPGAAFVLDPLFRKKKNAADSGGADEFTQITTLSAIPTDGSPRAFPVIMDLQDAWNKFPKTEVGAVYLSRQPNGSLTCFNSRCPHLGCTINYVEKAKQYVCPCHASAFQLDGERTNLIPPRSMDPLVAEIRNGDEVWVKFQNFRAGSSERKVIG